ncbi:hypothetical protein ACJMCD_28260 (plasmid) [Priestia megaterium]|uniref:hypothetical protein n=1 Tax=Priestia megaterium TaxID=1404 RepID=UPI00389A85F8
MEKELIFKSYMLLFEIEIKIVSIIEHEMITQYGSLWRQLFFVKCGTDLYDNLPLLFRLNPLQTIFTDHELHDLCILTDIKNNLVQLLPISQDDVNHLISVLQDLNQKKALLLFI